MGQKFPLGNTLEIDSIYKCSNTVFKANFYIKKKPFFRVLGFVNAVDPIHTSPNALQMIKPYTSMRPLKIA